MVRRNRDQGLIDIIRRPAPDDPVKSAHRAQLEAALDEADRLYASARRAHDAALRAFQLLPRILTPGELYRPARERKVTAEQLLARAAWERDNAARALKAHRRGQTFVPLPRPLPARRAEEDDARWDAWRVAQQEGTTDDA